MEKYIFKVKSKGARATSVDVLISEHCVKFPQT